ncbi:unnamed protein product [Knipowitschia caucasica]
MHRNLLLPCDFLPAEDAIPPAQRQKKKCDKRTKQTPQKQSSDKEDDWRDITALQRENRASEAHYRMADEVVLVNEDLDRYSSVEDEDLEMDQRQRDTESQDRVDDTHSIEEDISADSDQEHSSSPPGQQKKYPFRQRKPKAMFTYHRLGQPSMSYK